MKGYKNRFRTLAPGGKVRTFQTAAERDEYAAGLAKRLNANVALEEWSADHAQDEVNEGWACVGVARPQQTWTFVGHWDNDEIVVEHVVPGEYQDPRQDVGYWPQGLFAASGTGATQEEALAAVRAEYEEEPDGAPCCPDPGCGGSPCTFPGYASNH
jgi:hypothetical protein